MPRILVVDDDPAICSAYRAALRHEGYTVQTAATAATALEVFDAMRPDLVLLDIHLGEAAMVDGVDLLLRMRARQPAVQVVMVSAYLDLVTQYIAREAGAVDCWPKPISLPTLVERTAAVLAQAGICAGVSVTPA